jgi:environmental stress-induced protein Ves
MHASPDRFKVLRAKSYARMPWKNGGGETREIAIFPSAASLDTLEWRVSMAVVAQNGPFSSFPGIDRTLCVLEGAGMELDFGSGGGIRTVTPTSAPFEFAADRPLQARLLDGAITDLSPQRPSATAGATADLGRLDGELDAAVLRARQCPLQARERSRDRARYLGLPAAQPNHGPVRAALGREGDGRRVRLPDRALPHQALSHQG